MLTKKFYDRLKESLREAILKELPPIMEGRLYFSNGKSKYVEYDKRFRITVTAEQLLDSSRVEYVIPPTGGKRTVSRQFRVYLVNPANDDVVFEQYIGNVMIGPQGKTTITVRYDINVDLGMGRILYARESNK